MRFALVLLLVVAGCSVSREKNGPVDRTCTNCHGDSSRGGDQVSQAAPPFDLHGNTDVRFPGVGSHQRHLTGSEKFPKVSCDTCHKVPKVVLSPGHDDGTTQVIAPALDGGLAYDRLRGTCGGGTCHQVASGVWTQPRSSADACGSCHGVPPPAPHPQAGACEACHGPLTAATHVDGEITRVAERCDVCHGFDGGAAPPMALDGGTSPAQRGVGAHQAHLRGGEVSKPVSCDTCHLVPDHVATASHPNGGPAEVRADAGFDLASGTCTNGCHHQTPIAFTRVGPLGCSECHGAPPPVPHPQVENCALCHPPVDASHREHHVDGVVDLALPTSCDGCHGSSANAAPPRSLDGGTSPAQPGVGAHQAHVVGRGLARVVLCEECHAVPSQVVTPGHLNGAVEVKLSGVAVNAVIPGSYVSGTCTTACHDLSAYTNGASAGGDTSTPSWVGPAGVGSCTFCHGQPPPSPHPPRSDCGSCHDLSPAAHVNGHLDLLP